MIREGIFAQDGQEQSVPPVVVVRGAIQNQGHEDLDVEDGDGSGVPGSVHVEGRGPIGLRLALVGERGRAFALLARRSLGVGLSHGEDEGRRRAPEREGVQLRSGGAEAAAWGYPNLSASGPAIWIARRRTRAWERGVAKTRVRGEGERAGRRRAPGCGGAALRGEGT